MPVAGFVLFATAVVYSAFVLFVAARLTGPRLIATVLAALVPAALLMPVLPKGRRG